MNIISVSLLIQLRERKKCHIPETVPPKPNRKNPRNSGKIDTPTTHKHYHSFTGLVQAFK